MEFVLQDSGVFEYFKSKGLEKESLHLPWMNLSKNGETKEESRAKYYGQITKQNVKELYMKYEFDHKLFDYDIEPFLQCAK